MLFANARTACLLVPFFVTIGRGQEQPPEPPLPTNTEGVEAPGGESLLESLASRETVASSALETLSLSPGTGARRAVTWGPAGEKSVPLEDLLFLKLSGVVVRSSPLTLFLRDGCELVGSIASPSGLAEGGTAEVCFVNCPGLSKAPLRVLLDTLKGLLLHNSLGAPKGPEPEAAAAREPQPRVSTGPRSPASVRLRNEILRSRPRKDLLVFLEEGRAQGILDSITPEGIKFSSEGLGDIQVGFDKLRAVLLSELTDAGTKSPPKEPQVDGLVRVTLRDGTVLQGQLVEIQSKSLSITTATLGLLKTTLGDCVEIAFLGGRVSFLSDREPVRVEEHLPAAFTANSMPFQRDSSVLQGPLRIGGREYRKGLGVHSYSLLEYDLASNFTRFQAMIGLDESARPPGSRITGTEGFVIFRVRLDGRLLLEKPLSWRNPGEAVDLDVKGGKLLSLEVDCGKAGDASSIFNFALDRANWAEARLIR